MSYTHPHQEQKYPIYALLKKDHKRTEIAKMMGVHKSIISEELHRN